MFDFTPIIQTGIWLVVVIITYVLIPYIKSRTTAQQREDIAAWVKIAVTAAEQLYRGDGRGREKKEYVLQWLSERKITVDEEQIDALIEAAVYELGSSLTADGIAATGSDNGE